MKFSSGRFLEDPLVLSDETETERGRKRRWVWDSQVQIPAVKQEGPGVPDNGCN